MERALLDRKHKTSTTVCVTLTFKTNLHHLQDYSVIFFLKEILELKYYDIHIETDTKCIYMHAAFLNEDYTQHVIQNTNQHTVNIDTQCNA